MLEKCDSGFSVFVTQGLELRIPTTLRVVGKLLEKPEESVFLLKIVILIRKVLILCPEVLFSSDKTCVLGAADGIQQSCQLPLSDIDDRDTWMVTFVPVVSASQMPVTPQGGEPSIERYSK